MTLAEMLICIGIIGVIAALTLPLLRNIIPTKEESFHKKANYTVEQVVTQLYDDESMYPRKSDFYAQGFQNTEKVTINGVDYEGNEKFCRLFASKFMISSESGAVVCENQINESNVNLARGKRSFRSKDNVDWYLPVTNFQKGSAEIMVDVNGDDLPNCIEGTNGCNNPDRFIYYVKPNGSITYSRPQNVTKNLFNIDVNVTTDGCLPGGTCSETGGTYAIATLGNNGSIGTFSNGESHFKNLASNTRYIIKAEPKYEYYVDWSTDNNPKVKSPAKRVKIYNSDLKVDLKFHKKSTYCVIVDVKCDAANVNNCASYILKSGCGYKKVANLSGHYKLNPDGAYEYVGSGVDGAQYDYVCEGVYDAFGKKIASSKNNPLTTLGHPIINSTTGAITSDTSYNAVYGCGFVTGDYKLIVTPKSGYTIEPGNKYEQDVRLGTENLTFEVSVNR